MKKFKFLIFLLILQFGVNAQCEFVSTGILIPKFYGVTEIYSYHPDTIFLNVENGSTIRSLDGGQNWSKIGDYIGDFVSSTEGLRALEYKNSVPYLTRVQMTSDAGNNWSNVSLLFRIGREYDLISENLIVEFLWPSNNFNISNNKGVSWSGIRLPIDSSNGHPLLILNYTIKNRDTMVLIAAGFNGSNNSYSGDAILFSTVDGGISWDTVAIKGVSAYDCQNQQNNRSISIQDSMIVVIPLFKNEIIRSFDLGYSWDTLHTLPDHFGSGTFDLLGNKIIVKCTTSNSLDTIVAISEDLGQTWNWLDVKGPLSTSFWMKGLDTIYAVNFSKVAIVNDKFAWSGTHTGEVYKIDENCPPSNFLDQDMLACDSVLIDMTEYRHVDSIRWSDGDTSFSKYLHTDSSYVATIYSVGGCEVSDTISIQRKVLADPILTRTQDTLYTNSNLIHTWYKDGNILTGQTDSFISGYSYGNYSVIISDSSGCQSDTSNFINYTAGFGAILQNGVVRVYPNPSNGGVILQFEDITFNKIISIRLFSQQGQELNIEQSWKDNSLSLKWDIDPQLVLLLVETDKGSYRQLILEQ
jgi:hypothetical protein